MKTKIYILITTLIILFLTILYILLYSIINYNNYSNQNMNKDFKIEEINKIIIDVDVADIEVIKNVENKIEVEIFSNRNNLTITNNESLRIIETKKFFLNNFNIKQKIILKIPTDYTKNIILETKVGDIFIESMKNKFNIKNDVGDINFSTLYNITAKTNLGKISGKRILEYADLKSNLGDIIIEKVNVIKDSDFNTNLGNIKIKETDNYVDAKTSLGNISINKNNRKSEYYLNLSTDLGDIKVNY